MGTAQPGIQIEQSKRPVDCPSCQHNSPSESCGLLTFSASQLGAVVALIVGAILYLVQIAYTFLGWSKPALEDNELIFFREEFWAVLFLSALYYTLGEWVQEEKNYHRLRAIRGAELEFWVRVGLAAMFAVAVAGPPEVLDLGVSRTHASFLVLAVIYLGFLLWDVIVALGGEPNLAWEMARLDFPGGALILACLWLHSPASPAFELITPFLLLAMAVMPFVLLYKSYKQINFWNRIRDRASRR